MYAFICVCIHIYICERERVAHIELEILPGEKMNADEELLDAIKCAHTIYMHVCIC